MRKGLRVYRYCHTEPGHTRLQIIRLYLF
jgi:hypothetical protein